MRVRVQGKKRLIVAKGQPTCLFENHHHDHRTKDKSKTTASSPLCIPRCTDIFEQEIEDEMVCPICTLMLSHPHLFQG